MYVGIYDLNMIERFTNLSLSSSMDAMVYEASTTSLSTQGRNYHSLLLFFSPCRDTHHPGHTELPAFKINEEPTRRPVDRSCFLTLYEYYNSKRCGQM